METLGTYQGQNIGLSAQEPTTYTGAGNIGQIPGFMSRTNTTRWVLSETKVTMYPLYDYGWKQLSFYMKIGSLTRAITEREKYPIRCNMGKGLICLNGSQSN